MSFDEIRIPGRYNYIAVFLTMGCNLRCSFCINKYGDVAGRYPMVSGAELLKGLNRIKSRIDLPLTLQGGEPTLHPDFYEIVNGIRKDLNIDLLTNLQFDVDEFMSNVSPDRLKRSAPYASIRVSYHPEQMDLDEIKKKVLRLMKSGYSVGVWAVDHPAYTEVNRKAMDECRCVGIDFRMKDYLGMYEGALHGNYKYQDSISGKTGMPDVECRTSELIVGPDGSVFRCHSDLYEGRKAIGVLMNPSFQINDVFRDCSCFGRCNPCDVKVKTNRFQEFGHTSVEIRSK